MKVAIGLLVILAVLAISANSKAIEDVAVKESIFERTFKRLHREPPLEVPFDTSRNSNRAASDSQWIEQKVDNFNEDDDRTWQMRYLANEEYFQEGGPIFIYVGGEWEISAGRITTGHFVDMAKEHNGYLFYTEHRYYGQSKPLSNMSNENIKYLTVRQALADLAHFITYVKSTISGLSNSKVILAGGSYSATMVTWFKKLYPDLATGVWASSAPLLAKSNFYEYKEVMGQSVTLISGESCYNRIANGIAQMEQLFADKRGAEVKAMLKLCNAFDPSNDLDLWTLFWEISEIFAGIIQYHSNNSIQNMCNKIMQGDDDLEGVAKFILSDFGGSSCNDLTYKTELRVIMDSTFSNNIMRQWTYQTCLELGWFQSSASRRQPFGTKYPLIYFTTMCGDAFGEEFTNEYINNQIASTNQIFGGLTPEIENAYYSHGQVDPWRAMGIQDVEQATIIPLHAHCADFNSISDSDSAEMRASKVKLAGLVREWLSA